MKIYKGSKRLFDTIETETSDSTALKRIIQIRGISSLYDLKNVELKIVSSVDANKADETVNFTIINELNTEVLSIDIELQSEWVYANQVYYLSVIDDMNINVYGANICYLSENADNTRYFHHSILSLLNGSTSDEITSNFGSIDNIVAFKKAIREHLPIKLIGDYINYDVIYSNYNSNLSIATDELSVTSLPYAYSIVVVEYNPSINVYKLIVKHFSSTGASLESPFSSVLGFSAIVSMDTIHRLSSLESNLKTTNTDISDLSDRVTALENNSSSSLETSINGEFIKYNYREGDEITNFVPVSLFNKIAPGYTIDYTSTLGTGYSIPILQTKRYVDGTFTVLAMVICNGSYNNYLSELYFSLDSDSPDVVFLGASGPYSGGGGEACFTGDTLVLTEHGQRPIEEIQVNDEVLSYNRKTGEQEFKPVTAIISHNSDKVYTIKTTNSVIMATYDHPVHTIENGLTLVSDLSVGNHLLTNTDDLEEIICISKNKDEYVVYDISVKDNHTYYVGQDSVLVYNEKITNIY